jgi:hypothetical protein
MRSKPSRGQKHEKSAFRQQVIYLIYGQEFASELVLGFLRGKALWARLFSISHYCSLAQGQGASFDRFDRKQP